jgi:hypothetical protein
MIRALAAKRGVEKEMELFQELMPAIRQILKSGGGADQVLKKSEPLAAVNLVKHAHSEDAGVALKASIEILNRVSGKPVERSMNIYADISKTNEADLDNQILRILEQSGAKRLVEDTLDISLTKKKKKAQKRKPRKADFLDVEATVVTPNTDGSNETK